MFKVLLLAALVLCAFAARDAQIIKIVNSNPQSTWVAGENKFSAWSKEEIKQKLVRTSHPQNIPYNKYQLDVIRMHEKTNANKVPTEFDGRKQWPKCIHPIRDQAKCGSCWAFGASESFSDRLCIASNGTIDVVLSPQDLVSCDWFNMGCNGGMLLTAWNYMFFSGLVPEKCFPYQSQQGNAPACPSSCAYNSTVAFKSQKYYLKEYYPVGTILLYWERAEKIAQEIMTGGSLEVAFSVYEDFLSYKSGVYKYTTGEFLGGHAVKAVGWGVDSATNTPYWIIANSWSTTWGEDGYFRIQRGTDECGIEAGAYSGIPDLKRIPK